MQAVILNCPAIMQPHSIWSGMDQRQRGEQGISVLKPYGFIRCQGERIKFTYQSTSEMAAESLNEGTRSESIATDQGRPLSC